MRTRASLLVAVLLACGPGLSIAADPPAKTTTAVAERNFEVLAVDGKRLIFRDERGTHELTVPDNFRFRVDGKPTSVKGLKAGMKGKATVTTKTTIKPVTVTEVREGTVITATPFSRTIRGSDGIPLRFTQSELDERGIEIIKDGQIVRMRHLSPGDRFTATIVSKAPPTVVTEKDVDVKLDKPAPSARAAPASVPASAAKPARVAEPLPVPSSGNSRSQSQSSLLWVGVLVGVAAAVAYFLKRQRRAEAARAGGTAPAA